jgi:sugar phosphate isomerase/epimerase
MPEVGEVKQAFDPDQFQYAMALSAKKTLFGPIVFAGRLEDGFTALAKAGFHCVEMSMRFADDVPLDILQAMLRSYGLRVTALATGQGCIHDQLCLANKDPALFQEAVKRLEAIIDLAAKLGADVIIGGVRGKLGGSIEEQETQRSRAMEGFTACDRHAEERGVRLLIEPINRYETNFINNASEAIEFIQATGSRTAKVLFDTFHSNIEEVNLPATLHQLGDRLGYVHIADSNRQAPGRGHLDFTPIFETLGHLGYQGVVSAEILPLPDDASAVVRTANFLNGIGVNMQIREFQD